MSAIDLDQITIASPCTADWDAMQGDERVRFCDLCELNVYNLSEMGRDEAQELVRETEGKICVRLYKRRDGTLISQDCPVGLRAKLRRKLSWIAGLAASLLATVGGVFVGARGGDEQTGSTRGRLLPVVVQGDMQPEPPEVTPEPIPEPMMGAMVCPDEPEPQPQSEPEPQPTKLMGRIAQPR